MQFEANKKFFDQVRRYALVFTCEHCAYYEVKTGGCIHGYPNEVHKNDYCRSSPRWIVPCKDFEMI